jgi:Spy/CpxP family protein refolding chaperone
MSARSIALLYAMALVVSVSDAQGDAGGGTRPIKSLSPENVQALLAGDGMGLAKAAELNGHPGPRHVLELADQLKLSDDQRRASQAIFNQMHAQAVSLGRQLVDAEHVLNERFAQSDLSAAELDRHLAHIAQINAALRGAHLKAHLAQRRLLTAAQIRHYALLRGYSGSEHSMHQSH